VRILVIGSSGALGGAVVGEAIALGLDRPDALPRRARRRAAAPHSAFLSSPGAHP
jgi:uncharacterized protein YbjT (DUF2867 family)